jgi:hypothetical protein
MSDYLFLFNARSRATAFNDKHQTSYKQLAFESKLSHFSVSYINVDLS